MIFIYGSRNATIKKDTYNYTCTVCNSSELDVKVYRRYFHLLFIPLFPYGRKQVTLHCKKCGDAKWIEPIVEEYKKSARTPFYLYTLPILFAAAVVYGFGSNFIRNQKSAKFVDAPQVGDVYHMSFKSNDSTIYYFGKVSQVNGDSVIFYQNAIFYYNSSPHLNKGDFFRKDLVKKGPSNIFSYSDVCMNFRHLIYLKNSGRQAKTDQ